MGKTLKATNLRGKRYTQCVVCKVIQASVKIVVSTPKQEYCVLVCKRCVERGKRKMLRQMESAGLPIVKLWCESYTYSASDVPDSHNIWDSMRRDL